MTRLLELIARWWCRVWHDRASWPMHGSYTCFRCWRKWEVPW